MSAQEEAERLNNPQGVDGKVPCRKCWKLVQPGELSSSKRPYCQPCDRTHTVQRHRAVYKYCHGCKKRRRKDLFASLEKGSRCNECLGHVATPEPERAEKQCRGCKQILPMSEFGLFNGWPYSRCHDCKRKMDRGRKRCCVCGKFRAKKKFGDRASRSTRPACLECVPVRVSYSDEDLTYDFAFARDVLEMSTKQALEWISRGYRCDMESLQRRFPSDSYSNWEPDPWNEEVAV